MQEQTLDYQLREPTLLNAKDSYLDSPSLAMAGLKESVAKGCKDSKSQTATPLAAPAAIAAPSAVLSSMLGRTETQGLWAILHRHLVQSNKLSTQEYSF